MASRPEERRTVEGEPPSVPLREVYSAETVRDRIEVLVGALFRDFGERPFVMVVIEKGGRRFAARLVEGLRARGGRPELLYIRAKRTEGERLGEPRISPVEPRVFTGRDVLVVDDIVDEGLTMQEVLRRIQEGGPCRVQAAVLVDKRHRRKADLNLDYVGFRVEEGWVVGYGMDLNEQFRELDYLALVEPDSAPRAARDS